MRKSLEIGIFLAAVFLFIGAMGLTAEAADVGVDTVNKILYIEDSADYDLDDVYGDADVDDTMLWEESTDVWLANYSIIINASSALRLNPTDGCTWLKLNSSNTTGLENAHINASGRLFVNDTMVTGWNLTGDCNQTWNGTDCTFRPYIYIKPETDADDTRAVFLNSTISYLGYNRDNRYGIVYEDIAGLDPTGYMHNCTVMENFIGIDFQGCENMNVTNTWMNNTHEVGIVYTTGGVTGEGSHGGFIGDHPTLTHRASYDSVSVDYCSGVDLAGGIRLCYSDNISMNQVNIQDANGSGLRVESCNNLTANATTCYLNTNAASDYNIYLIATSNSTFTNCTAYSPSGAANGGNWKLSGSGTCYNNFTDCSAFDSDAHEDFYLGTGVHNNFFTDCLANNSKEGFYCLSDNNNTFTDCISHNHTYYDFKFWGSQYNTITNGYANDSAVGVYIYDDADYNTVTGLEVNSQSSYGIQIGTTDDISHDNTIEAVTIVGTTTGDGIYIFGNCTDNWVGNSSITGCSHANADGMGLADYAYDNTFYNCNSSNSGDAGFSLIEYANNNTIDNCTAYGNSQGLEAHGDGSRDNTISYLTSWNNDWGVFMWPNSDSNCRDNNFSYCEIHNNTYDGVDYGRAPINYFHYCNIKDNGGRGVEISSSGVAEFLKCVVWNSGSYDWDFDNTTTVDVYGDYILGSNRTVNNQSGVLTVYKGWVDHDSGDGAWLLDTYEMGVWATGTGDYVWINLTYWQTDYRQWYGTASGLSSSLIRQYCGGLTSGTKYDLLVDHAVYGTYTARSGQVIGSTAGIVWFNYTGTWSDKLFEIMLHTEAEPPGAGPGAPAADKNDIEVYVLTNDDEPIVGATVYIYENSVLVKSGITDADGLYDTTLDDGTYKFVASADDYREEHQTKTITSDTTVVFRLTPVGICPAIFAGPYLGISVLGWIVVAILVLLGFILAYLIDSKQLSKDYLVLILFPNVVLVVLGLFCHLLLIVIGVACCIIQWLWAKEEKL